MTALDAWNAMMARPLPLLQTAFVVRDAISKLFGVKPIKGFRHDHVASVEAGEKLAFFDVEHVTANRLVLTVRDHHLDVMITLATQTQAVTITASVAIKNKFGHVYMAPVRPAHRLIVRSLLKRLS